MKASNRLTDEFLRTHANDAARILEQQSDEMVISFLATIPPDLAALVISQIITPFAVKYIQAMEDRDAAQIIDHMKTSSAARLLQAAGREYTLRLLNFLSEENYRRIQKSMVYPYDTAGGLMDPKGILLPDSILVSDAKKRIESLGSMISCEVYVIDENHKLAGVVELSRLMSARPESSLRAIMDRQAYSVPARARIKTLLGHKAWKSYKTLPVIELDNVVAGVLRHKDMLDAVSVMDSRYRVTEPSGDAVNVSSLYWYALTDTLDTVLTLGTRHKENR